ncbi:EscU/YscU/HrcU family type III secretion system export apparatus switch protein [Haliovirga abyssi]|uniref:Flagellar biosynthetic protein FlhB n=1 Tax=Haliovirga abyssi TaxID=2996794 RepID=A0AAU9E3P6_9FUSO|nr:EscU/YscU/HrcU family type III secretion system export apparatus switch protein [Haliovirga abyssi]BDU51090.1 flagellar biosynthetic protein FlhB [Haliovirga abyssi]
MKKKAVGLVYDKENDNSPKVITKGEGYLAEKIIEIAKENGIYIKEDKSLVEILSKLDISEEIPEELYEIIAEIFLYVYSIEKED